jgi:hypothetical protein
VVLRVWTVVQVPAAELTSNTKLQNMKETTEIVKIISISF